MIHRLESIAIAGLRDSVPVGIPDVRSLLDLIGTARDRFPGVQLDCTMPTLRARELDSSARKDLAGSIRRRGLQISGLDLLIPSSHFTKPEHVDRAVEVVLQTLNLAADLTSPNGHPAVTVSFPSTVDGAIRATLADHAVRCGVALLDISFPPETSGSSGVGVAFDIAASVLADTKLIESVVSVKDRLGSVRRSDASTGMRVPPGKGDCDPVLLEAALAAAHFEGPMVTDLRGVPNAFGWIFSAEKTSH